jgi:hypothetical protein
MPALGQKQTLQRILVMSALPPKADMEQHETRLINPLSARNRLMGSGPHSFNVLGGLCWLVTIREKSSHWT